MTVSSPGDNTPAVSVRNVRKVFRSQGGTVAALDDLSIDVYPGELVVLLGPSGCGKTTLLRSIAGLETPDAGEISINSVVVFSSATRQMVLPEARNVSMVFQSYALWPHFSVFNNVAYPLRARGVPKGQIAGQVEQALDTVSCLHLKDRYPHQLSGGQQQRIALARAIVARQGVILFDEPLSNVDAKVRERLRIELVLLQRKLGFAAVYVTHDQTEAMIVGDRIAVLDRGRIVQIGTPTQIYNEPATRYVADFIGTSNFLPGTVGAQDGDELLVQTSIGLARCPAPAWPCSPGQKVEVFFRPEHCEIAASLTAQVNCWRCSVETKVNMGPNREYILRAGEHRLLAWTTSSVAAIDEPELDLHVPAAKVRLLPATEGTLPSAGEAQ